MFKIFKTNKSDITKDSDIVGYPEYKNNIQKISSEDTIIKEFKTYYNSIILPIFDVVIDLLNNNNNNIKLEQYKDYNNTYTLSYNGHSFRIFVSDTNIDYNHIRYKSESYYFNFSLNYKRYNFYKRDSYKIQHLIKTEMINEINEELLLKLWEIRKSIVEYNRDSIFKLKKSLKENNNINQKRLFIPK